MTVLTIISALFLILLIGFLFTPVYLYVDTSEERYEAFHSPVFRFSLTIQEHMVLPKLTLLGINIPLPTKEKSTGVSQKPATKKAKRTGIKKSFDAWRFLIRESVKSFDIRKVEVDVDTDDVLLNAQLVPVFLWATRGSVKLNTNFNGRVYFHLEVTNLPVKILWIFFRFSIKK
jgi:hypothetical protein